MTNVVVRRLAGSCLAAAMTMIGGCGDGSRVTSSAVGPKVQIIYQGNHLADVQVSLHLDKATVQPILQGISNAEGIAVLLPIAGNADAALNESSLGAESMMPVTLQSFGDGGWILDPKLSELARSPLSVHVSQTDPPPVIEIPRGGVKPL
jgi:hypothetical protein